MAVRSSVRARVKRRSIRSRRTEGLQSDPEDSGSTRAMLVAPR